MLCCFNSNGDIDLNHRTNLVKKGLTVKSIPVSIQQYKTEKSIEIDVASYVGFLINSNAIKKVGYPRKEYFIFYDDTEHSIRLKKYGSILLVPSSKINHLAPIFKGSSMSDNWKIYYQYRNRLKTINDHFGGKYIIYLKFMIILKIVSSYLLGHSKYSAMLKNALIDYKKL